MVSAAGGLEDEHGSNLRNYTRKAHAARDCDTEGS